jgi:exopolysaccharide biosynthesis predicted pyruvyltransferase EpsI
LKSAERSYTTGKNKNKDVLDNDFGDIVIADFNFDKRDDFAVKNDEGGNGGPSYRYYTQTADKRFILNNYLTYNMVYFPSAFYPVTKSLVTIVHANAMGVNHNTFRLDTVTNKWKFIRRKFVGVQ